MLNLELLAQGGDHSVVQVCIVVRNDSVRNTVPADEVLFDETGNHILRNGGEGSCFDPLGKIIYATRMKRCPLDAVGLISPIMSMPHITKGQGVVKTFRGTRGTCTLSAQT